MRYKRGLDRFSRLFPNPPPPREETDPSVKGFRRLENFFREKMEQEVDLVMVESAKKRMLMSMEMLGARITDALDKLDEQINIKTLQRGSSRHDAATKGLKRIKEDVAATTPANMENFGEVHESIYSGMGKISALAPIEEDGDKAWSIVNWAVRRLYIKEKALLQTAMGDVKKARSMKEIDMAITRITFSWTQTIDKTSEIICRLHLLGTMTGGNKPTMDEQLASVPKFSSYDDIQAFQDGKTLMNEVNRLFTEVDKLSNVNWVTRERTNTKTLFGEALQLEAIAGRIEGQSEGAARGSLEKAEYYEEAAENAAEAARSFMHSNSRSLARQKVLSLYAQAALNFLAAGEFYRASNMLENAMEISSTTLHNKRAPPELVKLGAEIRRQQPDITD